MYVHDRIPLSCPLYGVHTQYSVLARQETGSNGVTYLMPYYSAHGVVMVVRLGELNYKVNVVRCSVEVATHASVPYAGHGHYSFIVSEEVCTCIDLAGEEP